MDKETFKRKMKTKRENIIVGLSIQNNTFAWKDVSFIKGPMIDGYSELITDEPPHMFIDIYMNNVKILTIKEKLKKKYKEDKFLFFNTKQKLKNNEYWELYKNKDENITKVYDKLNSIILDYKKFITYEKY